MHSGRMPPVMRKRRVVILGSTGSIGTSALKVARDIPDRMEVVGLAACSSVKALAEQIHETGVKRVETAGVYPLVAAARQSLTK